jgi:lipid A 3-O-deacylase
MSPSLRRLPFLPFAGALLALLAVSVSIASPIPKVGVRRGAWTLVTENDKYFAGTDRHYTNGLKLLWLGETTLDESDEFLQRVADFIPTLRTDAAQQRYKVGLALGQNIYTPADTETVALIPDDRPYGAWLYGSLLAQAQEVDGRMLRVVELSVGMVGPSALGRETQNRVHRIINIPEAQGWDNQLKDEPGLILSWERRRRLHTWEVDGRRWLDVIGRGRLTLGNVHTHAALGGRVRLGWNLPRDFGTDLIRPAGGAIANAGPSRGFSAHLFASAEVRAVARNIFLDGNTWQDSHSVDKRPVIGDLSAGLVLAWPAFQFTYTQDMRTREYYGQDKRDVFGSVAVTFFR